MGIETELFVDPVDEELICSICSEVLDDPIQTPCSHVFCNECVTPWITSQHSCPSCRTTLILADIKPVLPLVRNLIMRSRVRCEYHTRGCQETMALDNLATHTAKCPKRPLSCTNAGCQETVSADELANHVRRSCVHRSTLFCDVQAGCGLFLEGLAAHAQATECIEHLLSLHQSQSRQIAELTDENQALKRQLEELQLLHQQHQRMQKQQQQQQQQQQPLPRQSMDQSAASIDSPFSSRLHQQQADYNEHQYPPQHPQHPYASGRVPPPHLSTLLSGGIVTTPSSTSLSSSAFPPISTSTSSSLSASSGVTIAPVPNCPNRSNPFHTCSPYCATRYGSTSPSSTSSASVAQTVAGCPNTSNPYHTCSDYCTQRWGTGAPARKGGLFNWF